MTRITFLIKIFLWALLMSSFQVYAIDDFIVTLKQISTSGKTIVFDTGHVESLRENDYGILLQKQIQNDKRVVFKPVARLRAIKVYASESVWVSYKTFHPEALKTGRGLYLFTENEVLRGRTDLTTKRLKLITKDGSSKELAEFLIEGNDLRQKKDEYAPIVRTHDKKIILDKDVELIDVDKWEDSPIGDYKDAVSVYRSPYAREFSEKKRVQTFEKMMVAFLNKYNNPSFDYDEFYKEQQRMPNNRVFQNKSVTQNYNDLYEKKVQAKIAKEEKFQENIQKKGEAWSDGYSDEELSELLNDINVVQEKQRRRKLVAFKYNSQVYLSAGFNLINNENKSDPDSSGSARSDFEFAWEFFLLKKYNNFKKFTLETSFRQAKDGLDAGNLNVSSTEYSMGIHLNWYPYYGPEIVERNIVYLGLLTRFGYSRLVHDNLGEEGNYQVSTFPGLRAGIKYNFKNSYGVRLTTGLESIKISRITRSADEGALPNSASYLEGKIGFGLSKFF